MKKKLVGTLAFALALSFGASLAVAEDAPDGATLFKKKCSVCHGADGTVTKAGEKLGAPAKLGVEAAKHTAEEIETIVTKGKEKMKGFEGKLTADEIKAVAAFAKTLTP